MHLDGDAETAVVAVRRARDREAADAPLAVDLDAELDVLTGCEVVPCVVRLEYDGARVPGLVDHLDDVGAYVVHGEHGVDVLEEAVDAVRCRHRLDERRREQPPGQSARGAGPRHQAPPIVNICALNMMTSLRCTVNVDRGWCERNHAGQ